jgi:adenylate kinase family enzyme
MHCATTKFIICFTSMFSFSHMGIYIIHPHTYFPQRSDDSEETIRRRLENFHRNIGPVMNAYRHVCQTFDGTRKPDEIFNDINDFVTFSGSSVVSQGLKVIISGAPASGKGTQCEKIVENFGVVHISTGDLLRSEISKGSEIGIEAKKWIDQGQLVPDEVIINMVRERLSQTDCKNKGCVNAPYRHFHFHHLHH